MSDIARLRPSSAHRWVNCPGSVMMQEIYPETETSEAAEEGTAMHFVAATVLKYFEGFCSSGESHRSRGKLRPDLTHWEGKKAPNGVIITEEMLEIVQIYMDRVIDAIEAVGEMNGSCYAVVEHPVSCDAIHPENRGTLDCGVIIEAAQADGSLRIYDFKSGWGVVEPFENWQLLNYAMGMLGEIHARGRPMPTHLDLRIVQPRPWHPLGPERKWVVQLSELPKYYQKMRAAAEEASGPAPRTAPGLHCNHCSARHACVTLNNAALFGAEIVGVSLPVEMPPEAISRQIRLLEEIATLVKARLEGVEAQAMGIIKSGGTIPGYRVQTGTGRRKWNKPLLEVIAMGELMEIPLKKDAVITPTQAIKAGIDDALVAAYSETPVTGLKLVRDDINYAKQVFSNG